MKRIVILVLVIGALSMAHAAQALPLMVGSMSIAAPGGIGVEVLAFNTAGTLLPNFTGATRLDFTTTGAPTPLVPGNFNVSSAFGSFLPLVGSVGKVYDFAFIAPGTTGFPFPPITGWETILSVGGFSFDLLSVSSVFLTANVLYFEGAGTFHKIGFDPTPGVFAFSATKSGIRRSTSFAFSSAQAPTGVPDAGSSLLLLGMGLVGLTVWKKRLV